MGRFTMVFIGIVPAVACGQSASDDASPTGSGGSGQAGGSSGSPGREGGPGSGGTGDSCCEAEAPSFACFCETASWCSSYEDLRISGEEFCALGNTAYERIDGCGLLGIKVRGAEGSVTSWFDPDTKSLVGVGAADFYGVSFCGTLLPSFEVGARPPDECQIETTDWCDSI